MPELFSRPLPTVAIALDLGDAVALEQICELDDHRLRRKRWFDFTDTVHNGKVVALVPALLTVPVADGEGHAVTGATARVDEGLVFGPRHWRALPDIGIDAGKDRLSGNEGLDVGAKLGEVFGLGTGRVFVHRLVNDALRHGWIHDPCRRLPEQRWPILAVVFLPSIHKAPRRA